MATQNTPAIQRLIDHVGSPTELARVLSERRASRLPPQNVFAWRRRGWASPVYLLELEPFMPPGMTLRELADDRLVAQGTVRKKAARKRAIKSARP